MAASESEPDMYPDRIKCSRCGKPCSTEVPIGTKIRGYVSCAACMRDSIAAADAAMAAELAQVVEVLGHKLEDGNERLKAALTRISGSE